MVFVWDAKNNFILLHSINLHQQQSLTLDIDWLSIVNDIRLEISSIPILLQNQYEHLLQTFYPKNDSKSLQSISKEIYLHSLCQQIEDDSKSTLAIVYEFVRHIRAKRIDKNDIEQLIKQWNFDYSSDEQKTNKERLSNILYRLHDYSGHSSTSSLPQHLSEHTGGNNVSATVLIENDEEEMEAIVQIDQPNSRGSKQNQLISDTNEQEKSSMMYRRRTQSSTFASENKTNKVNVGVEWFVPKFRRQQRSSSLHARSQSPIPIDSSSLQNPHLPTDTILMTMVDNNESSTSMDNTNLRQTQTQPGISWLPLTDKQILEKEGQHTKSQSIDMQDLEQVSSTDSDSIEIQRQTSSYHKTARSSSSHDLHPQEHSSCKRKRIMDEN